MNKMKKIVKVTNILMSNYCAVLCSKALFACIIEL